MSSDSVAALPTSDRNWARQLPRELQELLLHGEEKGKRAGVGGAGGEMTRFGCDRLGCFGDLRKLTSEIDAQFVKDLIEDIVCVHLFVVTPSVIDFGVTLKRVTKDDTRRGCRYAYL